MPKNPAKPNTKNVSKLTATALIIVMAVGSVFLIQYLQGRMRSKEVAKIAMSRTKGKAGAKIQITEYLDFECPACANGATVLKKYIEKNPSEIYLEVKYYPLPRMHPHALQSAMYAECAARQGKFWPFEELLIEKQKQWARAINATVIFQEMANTAGLDLKKLKACLADEEELKRLIFKEKSEGKSRGVDSTPTYFINGKIVVGPQPLTAELNKLLGETSH